MMNISLSHAQFQVNGDASQMSCKCYRLTPDQNTQSGSVWNTNQIDLTNPFDYTFDVFPGCNDGGADGLAFVLQPISTTVGSGGGGLGYQGINPSFAAEFDTYQNGWDPADDHIAIQQNGDVDHSTGNNLAGPVSADPGGANIEDCGYHKVRVTWDPATNTFEVYFDGNLRLSYTGNIINNIFGGNPNVYWGFTGATGGSTNDQRFCISVIANFLTNPPSVCQGNPVQFTDSSYSTVGNIVDWQWDLGDGNTSTQPNPSHTYLSAGTYNVEMIVTSSNTCKDTLVETVTVHPQPGISYSMTDPLCNGDCSGSITLNASGGTAPYQYSIDSAASFQGSNTFNNLCEGTYGMVVSDSYGCMNAAIDSLVDPPSLNYSATITDLTCYQNSTGAIDLTASGGVGDYEYSIDGGTTFQSSSNFNNLSAGSYTIVVQDSNGCQVTGTEVVDQPPELTFDTIAIQPATCKGNCDGMITVSVSGGTVSGGYQYNWSGGIAGNTDSIASGVCAGTYSLTVTDDNGCILDTTGLTVTEPNEITTYTSSVKAHCNKPDGKAVVDSISGGTAPYSVQWDANANNQTTDTADGLIPGNYEVQITDTNGCKDSATVNVGNIPGHSATIASSVDATCNDTCDGSAVVQVIGGTPPYSYQWSPNSGGQTDSMATDLCADTYYCVVSDSVGCIDTAFVTIDEPSKVSLSTSNDTTICQGSTANISANASGGTPGYTYYWDNGLGSGQSQSPSPTSDTTYTVIAADANGCPSGTSSVEVDLLPPVQVDIQGADTICPGSSITLSANPSGGTGNYNHQWSKGANGQYVTVSPTSNTDYIVETTDNCSSPNGFDTVTVYLYPEPNIQFQRIPENGCAPLDVQLVDMNPQNTDCIWDLGNGETEGGCDTVNVTYEEPGCYDVTLTQLSPDGCSDSLTIPNAVCVNNVPEAGFEYEPRTSTTIDPDVNFTNTSEDEVSYNWNFAGRDSSTKENPSYKFPDIRPGVYPVCLTVKNMVGCPDSVCKTIRIENAITIYVPNAFSPDGDGKNDVFKPVVQGHDVENYLFRIYDRWGHVVFKTKDPEEAWDGSINGSTKGKLDTYIWEVRVKELGSPNIISRKGHVTLTR